MLEALPSLALMAHVCLIGDATTCRDISIAVDTTSNNACMMSSPPLLAKWISENPKWELKRWWCKPVGKTQDL